MMLKRVLLSSLLASVLWGCGGGSTASGSNQAIVLLNSGSMQRINLSTGVLMGGSIPLSEDIESIAISSGGILYGFGSDTKLYKIHGSTGACTAISSDPTGLSTNGAGMTVDPSTGNIRYVDADNNNYVLGVLSGNVLSTDPDVAFVTGDTNEGNDPNLIGCAFYSGAFYAIDGAGDLLARSTDIASGDLETIGSATIDFSGNVGFTINREIGIGYVVCDSGASGLYRVDLSTGQATAISLGVNAEDIAFIP